MSRMKEKDETYYNFKGLFKYLYTVITWTLFIIFVIIGVLLLYYYISVRLYATKGEKFEPKFSVYTIVSGSMEPTISVYDVIINTKVDKIEDIKYNDVITFISTWPVNSGMTVTHRVVGTKTLDDGQTCLITRGDNNTQDDPTCVKKGNIIGITRAVIPSLGKVQLMLANRGGWLLVLIIPALYIIIKDIFKIIRLKKDINKDKLKDKPEDNKKDNILDNNEETNPENK